MDCPICLELLSEYPEYPEDSQNSGNLETSSCGHLFHTKCLKKWKIGNQPTIIREYIGTHSEKCKSYHELKYKCFLVWEKVLCPICRQYLSLEKFNSDVEVIMNMINVDRKTAIILYEKKDRHCSNIIQIYLSSEMCRMIKRSLNYEIIYN